MARLGCIVAVLLLPLLLLASPSRAIPHGATQHARSARTHVTAEVHTASFGGSHASWGVSKAIAVDERTADTTTLPPVTTTTAAPVVRAAPVTTTTTTVPRTTTTTVRPTTTTTAAPAHQVTGQASWYQAATGTCASPNLPFGTVVTVTNLANGASTTCTVDDRQDPSTGRVLDMSEGSFSRIADPAVGVIEVRLTW